MTAFKVLKRFALLLVILVPALGNAVDVTAGPYKVSVSTDPAVIPVGNAKVLVHLATTSGTPVSGADVKVLVQMPGMPMGEREQPAVPVQGEPGTYSSPATFAMAGDYGALIAISGEAGTASTTVTLSTGQDTGVGSGVGLPLPTIAIAIVAILVASWIFARMRSTGSTPRVTGGGMTRMIVSILIIAVVVGGATWAIGNLRRPGAMTPLAAQGMAMETPPPQGALAVTLGTVESGSVGSFIRYTGQAVGYNEQDVYPRVAGSLIFMPLYAGDKIQKGQVLARLDTSQLTPQVASRRAMAEAARKGLAASQADYKSASAMVDQANAEHGQYMAAIDEAEANLNAAKSGEAAMAAMATSADADVRSAMARRDSAAADATYWRQELARMEELFNSKALSRSEYQQAVSSERKARAALADMEQGVSSAGAKAQSAHASAQQAKSGVVAAHRKLDVAKNEMLVHRAHVAAAGAAQESAKQKAAQAAASLDQASADFAASVASEGYATITSPLDGVVIQRLASPGALVQPGVGILRIAQVDPIRFQANVPTSDLEKVRVGARVSIRTALGAQSVEAKVTSVSPNVDPAGRTGIVEALVPNADRKFMPGQFDSMQIAVGSAAQSLTVPNDALQGAAGGFYVWVAVAGGPGQYTTHRVSVEVAVTDGQRTSVKGELKEGQKVITSGFVNLSEGIPVAEAAKTDDLAGVGPSAAGTGQEMPGMKMPPAGKTGRPAAEVPASKETIVHVGTTSFDPSTVSVAANSSARITFIRTTEQTCATEVVFPELGITKSLPLNKRVTIELAAGPARTISFTCGMNMLKGKVVAQ